MVRKIYHEGGRHVEVDRALRRICQLYNYGCGLSDVSDVCATPPPGVVRGTRGAFDPRITATLGRRRRHGSSSGRNGIGAADNGVRLPANGGVGACALQ